MHNAGDNYGLDAVEFVLKKKAKGPRFFPPGSSAGYISNYD
jgi:hypothetical protein